MAGGGDSSGAVDVDTDVVVPAADARAAVDAHPNTNRDVARPRCRSESALAVAADHDAAYPGCVGEHGRSPWSLPQDRQLADVVARLIGPQDTLIRPLAADDADRPVDDHDELVAEVTLADDRLFGWVEP